MYRVLWAVLVLSGCAPVLHTRHRTIASYVSEQPCGQGPYIFEVKAEGARWEEGMALTLYSPHDVHFQWEASVDGRVVDTGALGRFRMVPDETGLGFVNVANGVDNERCIRVVPLVDEVASGPSARVSDAPPSQAMVRTSVAEQLALVPDRDPPPDSIHSWLIDTGRGKLSVNQIQLTNRDPNAKAIAPGAKIRIELWSLTPNHLDGVHFQLIHWSRAPRSEEAFVAWLQEKQKRQSERFARQRPRVAKRAARRVGKKPKRVVPTRKVTGVTAPLDVVAKPVQPGKPPMPVPEVKGIAPFLGATWTPGYWQWHDAQWVWISGWWSGQKPTLPERVPPTPASEVSVAIERPPNASAVYISGHWSIDIHGVTWVDGRWHVRVTP